MSDFDKEAEREKLREKYERDQADREATQRMSDLLLKGATMTNTHCGTCGDPLFRQDGVTFCPTCHGSPEAVEGSALDAESAADESDAADETAPGPSDGRDADEQPIDGVASEPADVDRERSTNARADAAESADGSSGSRPSADEVPRTARRPRSTGEGGPARSAGGASRQAVDGDLEAGHDALVAALERFAREAAETDDPRYAAECLEAAREASEALAALR